MGCGPGAFLRCTTCRLSDQDPVHIPLFARVQDEDCLLHGAEGRCPAAGLRSEAAPRGVRMWRGAAGPCRPVAAGHRNRTATGPPVAPGTPAPTSTAAAYSSDRQQSGRITLAPLPPKSASSRPDPGCSERPYGPDEQRRVREMSTCLAAALPRFSSPSARRSATRHAPVRPQLLDAAVFTQRPGRRVRARVCN
jgi:hypothetical protein